MSDRSDGEGEQDNGIKRTKHRSPNYPSIGLRKAVERVKELHDKYKRATVPINLAQELWGYTPHGSAGSQCVAALKAFGLLDVEGDGKMRKVRVSDPAYRILLNSPDRAKLVKLALLAPPIYKEMVDKYHRDDFPTELMGHYLRFDREDGTFNPDAVEPFIDSFLDSVRYSGLISDDIVEGEPAPDTDPSVDDPVEQVTATKPPSQAAPRHAGGIPGAGFTPAATVGGSSGLKGDVFTVPEGAVVIQWPERMTLSQDEAQDLDDWLRIMSRKVLRAAQKGRTPTDTE